MVTTLNFDKEWLEQTFKKLVHLRVVVCAKTEKDVKNELANISLKKDSRVDYVASEGGGALVTGYWPDHPHWELQFCNEGSLMHAKLCLFFFESCLRSGVFNVGFISCLWPCVFLCLCFLKGT